jgi:hypothetical protein
MKRWLFNLAVCVSLLHFLATTFLWVRGHWRADQLVKWTVQPGMWGRHTGLFSTIDQLSIIREGVDGDDWSWGYPTQSQKWWRAKYNQSFVFRHGGIDSQFDHFGFAWGGDSHVHGSPHEFEWFVSIPDWFLAIVFAAMPIYWLGTRVAVRRRRYRIAHNLCVNCGYDVRASPQRCPECGTIVEAGIA